MNPSFSAKNLIDTYWNGMIPVDYYAICNQLNILVEKTDLSTLGFLEKKGNQIHIYIDTKTNKDNVIIAFFLSKLFVGLNDGGYSLDSNDFNTSGANFNSQLAQNYLHQYLIPEFVFNSFLKDGYQSLQQLSTIFGVSEVLMAKAIHSYK